MNKIDNPFSPGAGTQPPELAGRDSLIEMAQVALARIKAGRSEKHLLFIGLRGVGKTVLLNMIRNHAEDSGFKTILLEAHDNKTLAELLSSSIRNVLNQLDSYENASDKVKRGFRVFGSFLSSIKLTYNDVDIRMSPEKGSADTGDLEFDLPNLLEALAEAAKDRGQGIAILIDEIQYLNTKELSALIMAVHKITQRQLPLVFIGAGLPQLPALAGNSKSYAERLFDYPSVGALSEEESRKALQEAVLKKNITFTEESIREIMNQTKGYPYFIQEWGYMAWNLANTSPIDVDVVNMATKECIKKLDNSFFKVRFERLTPKEKEYLYALAQMGEGQHRSGDIASKLGVKTQRVATIRDSLMKKGMIYSPSYGDTEFTVPLFDEFMKRAMRG